MGTPTLHTARLYFESSKRVSDRAEVTFGIREVTSELTAKGHRLFKVNGRKVLIRGAAWDEDMFLRWSSARLDADLEIGRASCRDRVKVSQGVGVEKQKTVTTVSDV